MLYGPIRAIVVDDTPEHLLTIAHGLSAVGIPCSSHLFDKETNEVIPPPPEGKYKYLRLIFMDLNLYNDPNPTPQNLFGVARIVLRKLLNENCGPYILYFWTEASGHVEKVIEYFYDKKRFKNAFPPPLEIRTLQKSPFVLSKGQLKQKEEFEDNIRDFYNEIFKKTPDLKKSILDALNKSSIIKIMSGWESRTFCAASNTINCLTDLARKDQPENPREISPVIEQILSKISVAAVGKACTLANPALALDEGLIEILFDQYRNSINDNDYKDALNKTIKPLVKHERSFINQKDIFSKLNTFFHIDIDEANNNNTRGCVIEFPNDWQIQGKEGKILIADEFLPNEVAKTLKKNEGADLQNALDSFRLVAIEIGAECDYANPRSRTIRFLLGVEVPYQHKEFLYNSESKFAHAALECFGPWNISDNSSLLLVSYRRFWVHQERKLKDSIPKYRLRAPLVNKLLHGYTTWSKRPGIVEFRI